MNAWKAYLEQLRSRLHHPENIGPDPVAFPRRFPPGPDREIAGYLAAAHALGRVETLSRTVAGLLAQLGPSLVEALGPVAERALACGVQRYYRFFQERQLGALLLGLQRALAEWGSLQEGLRGAGNFWQRVERWLLTLRRLCPHDPGLLIPLPRPDSPLKRPLLFLRWMVRQDEIDPGGWTVFGPEQLQVPLDTHLFSWARREGLISSPRPDRRAAEELTAFFRGLAAEDPCRYDFALARAGMLSHRGQSPGVTLY